MRNFISEKAGRLKPSGIRKFFDIVSEMPDAISLGVGEPDFITPWGIRDAAIKSIQKGNTQYTSNKGLVALREQTVRYLKEQCALTYDKEEIIITVGASEAIDITLRAVCDPGDEILVPEPSYVSYAPCVELAGGVAVAVKCTAENGFKLTPEMLEEAISKRTKALILPYPNNPTGAIMEREFLQKIVPIIKKHDLLVISDEIYSELTYGGKHVSVASFDGMRERTVVINGFSKSFAMTGWRIGYLAAPRELCDVILKIHQYVIMCAPTMSQYAALHALKEGFLDNFSVVEDMKTEYDRRRRFMVKAMNDLGLSCFEPKGSFYVFPSVKSTGMDGEEFASRLLQSQKLAVVPGSAFGESGRYHIRCSYAYSMTKLTEAVKRIELFIKELKG